jgi:hypothetical protein
MLEAQACAHCTGGEDILRLTVCCLIVEYGSDLYLLLNGAVVRESILAVFFLCVTACFAYAQESEIKRRIQAESAPAPEFPQVVEKFYLDYGAWLRYEGTHFDDFGADPKKRSLRVEYVSAWAEAVLNETHRFYLRALAMNLDYSKGDQYGKDDDRFYSPRLDLGFYEFRTRPGAKSLSGLSAFSLRIGRQYLRVGSGLAYHKVNDGLLASARLRPLSLEAFWSTSIRSEDDIDRSRPDLSHSHRDFCGLTAKLKMANVCEPYAFAVFQRDKNGEHPDDPSANYIFDSDYYGVGASGSVISKLNYSVEWIWERGRRCPNQPVGPLSPERIVAEAAAVKLEYLPSVWCRPIIAAEYLYSSGDPDRYSATDTQGGNTDGTLDRAFLGFGFVDAGYVLYPIVTNLHVYKLSGSIVPLQEKEFCRELRTGVALIWFSKDEREGAISDTRADWGVAGRGAVGFEFDLFATYKIFSDLSGTLRYGRFFPGSTYPDSPYNREPRDYFSFFLLYSF